MTDCYCRSGDRRKIGNEKRASHHFTPGSSATRKLAAYFNRRSTCGFNLTHYRKDESLATKQQNCYSFETNFSKGRLHEDFSNFASRPQSAAAYGPSRNRTQLEPSASF